jgi:hypothetical protein
VQPYKYQAVTGRVEGMYVSYTDFTPGLRTACVTEGLEETFTPTLSHREGRGAFETRHGAQP